MRLMLCALVFLCAAMIPVSASGASFSVDQIAMNESEPVHPGDTVRISARVSFDSSGEVTFPDSDTLQLSAQLAEPEWQYTLMVDNHPVQTIYRETGVIFINGYYLAYAQGRSEYLSVQVQGVVPDMPGGTIDALTVTQYDGYGNVRGDGISTVSLLVSSQNESVTPADTPVPESASPIPTKSPLNGFVVVVAVASAFAGILSGKKEV